MDEVYGIFQYVNTKLGTEVQTEFEYVFASPKSAQKMCDDINRIYGLHCFVAPIPVCN